MLDFSGEVSLQFMFLQNKIGPRHLRGGKNFSSYGPKLFVAHLNDNRVKLDWWRDFAYYIWGIAYKEAFNRIKLFFS